MPLYEYQCKECGITFDEIVSVGDIKNNFDKVKVCTCPECGGEAEKVLSIQGTEARFIGDGWTPRFYD